MMNEMTAEEAVKILRFEQEQVEHRLDGYSDTQENRNIYEAFRMAIKALEPKPMEKFDDVKTHIQRLAGDYKCWDNRLTWEEALELNRMLEAQPNSNEFFNFDAPMVKKSEAVSREQVIEEIEFYQFNPQHFTYESLIDDIKNLPPVTPKYTDEEIDKAQAVEQAYVDKMVELAVEETERPKGKWIDFNWNDGDICRWGIKCSECHTEYKHGGEMWHNPKFCPNCGSYNGGGEDETDS